MQPKICRSDAVNAKTGWRTIAAAQRLSIFSVTRNHAHPGHLGPNGVLVAKVVARVASNEDKVDHVVAII